MGDAKKIQKVFIREKLMKLKEMEEKLKRERIASQDKLKRLNDRSLEPPQLRNQKQTSILEKQNFQNNFNF